MLALGGNTNSQLYNVSLRAPLSFPHLLTSTTSQWFIGRSLNPSLGSLDIKSFNELRPGMILWAIIDFAMVAKQYNDLGRVTDSMILVVAFHTWYVVDALYNEVRLLPLSLVHSCESVADASSEQSAILSTMDITSDGFGFMLSVGDLVWVPFTYSYQAYYLSLFPNDLGTIKTVAIIGVQLLGYWIFRDSNGEKNDFRGGKNPKSKLGWSDVGRGADAL